MTIWPCVGRVGQDLLVAGHAGVEHDLAERLAARAEAAAGEDRAVFQGQFCLHWRERLAQRVNLVRKLDE